MKSSELELREARRRSRELVRKALLEESDAPLAHAIRELFNAVPRRSWVERAVLRFLLRTVERRGRTVYVVRGLPELGDWKDVYVVQRVGEHLYYCSCYSSSYGYVRRARICTHIAAVILYRRWRMAKREAGSGAGEQQQA
ncbi:MAG: hypothetical protein QXQ60_06355 [Thermofilum sp.]